MIFDAVPFRQNLSESNGKDRALRAFTDYLESKLGVQVVYDLQGIPFGRFDLIEPLRLGALLKEHGVIKRFGPTPHFPDEPQIKSWYAFCNDPTSHQTGGTTWESDEDALYAALAEALERYIWFSQDDYFISPIKATTSEIKKYGPFIAPEKFVGFSEDQRAHHPVRRLRSDASYLWIRGTSLIDGRSPYLPAQIVSGVRSVNRRTGEPFIRQPITNGLATWPTLTGARAAGALEIIEREAYMIMWLNQLTLPRIALKRLCEESPSLARTVATCERYRLKLHAISLLTDAPTNAVAVVMEDMSGQVPRFTIGIRAHWSLPVAIQKAATEALRAHRGYRLWAKEGKIWDNTTPIEKIGHRDRLYYWGVPENAKHLEFMVRGEEVEPEPKAWDNDTAETHLQRIIEWCKQKNFECVSFSLGKSAKNPTPLHIEMVVIPQLLPTYLQESVQQFGGTRWYDVPKALGYTPLKKPFSERPHPFS